MTDPSLDAPANAESDSASPLERRLRASFIAMSRRLCTHRPSVDVFLGELTRHLADAAELTEVGIWMLDGDERYANLQLRLSSPARVAEGSGRRHSSPLELDQNRTELEARALFPWSDRESSPGAPMVIAVPVRSEQKLIGFSLLEPTQPPEWSAMEQRWIVDLVSLIGACHHSETLHRPNREQRLARHRARLGLMAGGIAHDLNNLLVGVNGGLELAFQGSEPGSVLYEDLELIKRSAQRAVALSDSLLAFAGGRQTPLEPIVLNEVVARSAREAVDRHPGCELRLELDESLPDLQADPRQLSQIVANLISNAAHALGDSAAPVVARTGTFNSLGADPKDDWALRPRDGPADYQFFEVQDRGHGIPCHLRERAFEAFFTTRPGASGVGLAAVMGLMEARGGAIQLSSDPDHGTTVRVLFPVSTGSPVVPETPGPNPPSTGLVLIVDDDASVLATVSRMLNTRGHEVLTASSGLEALEIFKSCDRHIATVLIDVEMPGIDGIETLERLRKIEPDVKAVLISGYSPRVDLDTITSAPFLRKPFTGGQLLALLPLRDARGDS